VAWIPNLTQGERVVLGKHCGTKRKKTNREKKNRQPRLFVEEKLGCKQKPFSSDLQAEPQQYQPLEFAGGKVFCLRKMLSWRSFWPQQPPSFATKPPLTG